MLSKSHFYKIDVTESGGVSTELKKSLISYFENLNECLLVEEGGPGFKEHYHLHGIFSCNYNRSDNLRRKVFKPMYEKLGKKLTTISLKIREVSSLSGALSYVYKDKRVLICKSFDLSQIKPWENPQVNSSLKLWTIVGKNNYLEVVTKFCDRAGIRPGNYGELRDVMSDMTRQKFMFEIGPWKASVAGLVLQYYGDCRFTLGHWDYANVFT